MPSKEKPPKNTSGKGESLSEDDMLAITTNWDSTNKRRGELIEKKLAKQIKPLEESELSHLQKLAGAKRNLVMPLPIEELAKAEADLRKKGLWREE